MLEPLFAVQRIQENNDTRILACAYDCESKRFPDDMNFITNDLALTAIANLFFGKDSIKEVNDDFFDNYRGFVEVSLPEQEMAEFYSNLDYNHFNCFINEYILLKEAGTNEIVDAYKWSGDNYEPLKYRPINSTYLGSVKPKDWY